MTTSGLFWVLNEQAHVKQNNVWSALYENLLPLLFATDNLLIFA